MFILDGKAMMQNREKLRKGDPALKAAYDDLIADADKALKAGPFSVTDKTLTPDSGDKHDYMSMGPYWWPDPDKPDGLPYINRDGQVNPEYRKGGTDAQRRGKMTGALEKLCQAYYFSGDEKYAERAALLLRTWFLNPETRMNPNLNFGQAIPGRTKGRGIGIIESACFTGVVDDIGLLAESAAWTDADQKGMEAWFAAYLDWLLTSKHGRDEDRTTNNHGTYYDMQVASFALFTGKPEVAKKVLEAAKARRIATQIEPDGSQPHELRRTKSFGYSNMNLRGMFHLARLGEHAGVDLWHYRTDDGRSIRGALDYMAPFADPAKKKEWSHQQLKGFKPISLLPALWQGALVYKDPKYSRLIDKLPENGVRESRCQLWYAPLDKP